MLDSIGLINNYTIFNDFQLVCRKVLHTSTLNTPPEHSHQDFYELVTVVSGSAVHHIGGKDWHISAGNVFLIQPHELHNYAVYDNLLIYNLLFSRRFVTHFLPDLNGLPGYQLLFNLLPMEKPRTDRDGIRVAADIFPEVLRLLDEMDALNSSCQPGAKTLLISNFARVMLLFSRHCHWSGTPGQSTYIDRLSKLLSELERDFHKEWNLEKMARFCTMSVSNFRQAFHKYTGCSPIDYLLKLRLTKAAVMLSTSGKRLDMIAAECGFSDVNYFSRQFKNHYNIVPSQYRRKIK